ncbi:MAG: hypothetical protein ACO1N9_11250 [Flavobacterium sp.]
MSEHVTIGNISVAAIRDYLFTKRIVKGDSLVLNQSDYMQIIEEIKESGEPIDIPLNVLDVLLLKDTTGEIPAGKLQIIKNEQL